ncbi:HAMP domain-containing sensor histidine kinase [Leucothrix arctica]|nr:HAMP domain-containing sensor histidine kinase [Leucothrix arctica]
MKLLNKIRHSLSLRLLLLFVAAAIVLCVGFQVMMGYAISSHMKEKGAPHLNQYLHYLQQNLGSPPSIENAKQLVTELPINIQITTATESWSSSDTLPTLDDLYVYQGNEVSDQEVKLGFDRGQTKVQITEGDTTATLWTSPHEKNGKHGKGFLAGIFFLLLILAILYWFIRRLFRPIQTIQKSVRQIGAGDLSARIPTLRNDELGELSGSINLMADDIERMLEAKRELLLAISHELRSPLTRAKVSTALLDNSPNQANIARDLREMENLISELIEAERLNGPHQQLQKVSVSLNEIVMSVVDDYFPEADLEIDLAEELPDQNMDPIRMRLVVRNILENALKHQPEEAEAVQLSTQALGETTLLQVQDHGVGIAQQHIPHLTEAFYRVDVSRQRKTGGVGLGLYLVKRIVEAHKGQLTINSKEGVGTMVSVHVPVIAS